MESNNRFISKTKSDILSNSPIAFEDMSLEIFDFQLRNNPIYKDFVYHIKGPRYRPSSIRQIPFLPISLFKTQTIASVPTNNEHSFFLSSGTTTKNRSKHIVHDMSFYLKNTRTGFEEQYGKIEDYLIIAILPNYIDQGNSSLLTMMNHFINLSKYKESGFYNIDSDIVINLLEKNKGKKCLLFGVTYALLELAAKYSFKSENLIVMETGGMKGRGPELIREEVHKILSKAFHCNKIHSEYGMTELFSQAYSQGKGIFRPSKTMKVICRNIYDPFEYLDNGNHGAFNIIDLANIHSCSFIATDDIGKCLDNNRFIVEGRMSLSEIRGCNLLNFNN